MGASRSGSHAPKTNMTPKYAKKEKEKQYKDRKLDPNTGAKAMHL